MKRILLLLLLIAAPASAQRASTRFVPKDTARAKSAWTPVRVAKWSVLSVSTAAAIYGFTENRTADREYKDIELLCEATPASCARTAVNGPYSDAALEGRYQSVVRRDNRARTALLAGQIGLAASVVMFIIDLPKNAAPQDIPYQPHSVRVGVRDDRLTVNFTLAAF